MAVFVGASAGGVETLVELLSYLPHDLPAPVLVVLHISPRGKDMLAAILDRAGPLEAATATDGERLKPGVVYVAPRGRHMLVRDGAIALSDGPTEHGVRPAIDPLFRSGARCYGAEAIGVVLSGMLDDGTAGLGEIRHVGGRALAQDPDEALYPQMPTSAIAHVDVDWVLPVAGLAAKLDELVRHPLPAREVPDRARPEPSRLAQDPGPTPPGMRTDIVCPLCGGTCWETSAHGDATYRCHAGHTYSAAHLLVAQEEGLDDAIWRPVRMLHQRGALLQRLAEHARERGRESSATYFADRAQSTLTQAAKMRQMLDVGAVPDPDPQDDGAGAVP